MGIDFSHGEAHWSYSGFNRFRCKLIETMGLGDLNGMYDDGSYTKLSSIPIYALINHSDCDGDLTVKEMEAIIPQLDLIINIWEANGDDYDVGRGRDFITGMKDAIEDGESLEFM